MKYQANEETKDKLNFLIYSLIFVFFVGVCVVVFWVSSQRSRFEKREMVKEIVLEPMASVEARLVATSQTYSIKILNATGISGLAAKSAKQIEAEGVKINLQTGNAPSTSGVKANFKSSQIRDSMLGSAIKVIWPKAEITVLESQTEDLVLTIGN